MTSMKMKMSRSAIILHRLVSVFHGGECILNEEV